MYSNNTPNLQESTTILNASTKKVWKLIEGSTYVNAFEIMLYTRYATSITLVRTEEGKVGQGKSLKSLPDTNTNGDIASLKVQQM